VQVKPPPAKKPTAKVAPAAKAAVPLPESLDRLFPARVSIPTTVSTAGQKFSFNLEHLSPLRQAVIMAEILGPPKALNMNAGER
jgi:hypothetical protein